MESLCLKPKQFSNNPEMTSNTKLILTSTPNQNKKDKLAEQNIYNEQNYLANFEENNDSCHTQPEKINNQIDLKNKNSINVQHSMNFDSFRQTNTVNRRGKKKKSNFLSNNKLDDDEYFG